MRERMLGSDAYIRNSGTICGADFDRYYRTMMSTFFDFFVSNIYIMIMIMIIMITISDYADDARNNAAD